MIQVGDFVIRLDFDWQQGKKGEPFRLSKIEKGDEEKWIDRQLRHDWTYTFRYKNGKYFSLHIGIDGKIIKL